MSNLYFFRKIIINSNYALYIVVRGIFRYWRRTEASSNTVGQDRMKKDEDKQ